MVDVVPLSEESGAEESEDDESSDEGLNAITASQDQQSMDVTESTDNNGQTNNNSTEKAAEMMYVFEEPPASVYKDLKDNYCPNKGPTTEIINDKKGGAYIKWRNKRFEFVNDDDDYDDSLAGVLVVSSSLNLPATSNFYPVVVGSGRKAGSAAGSQNAVAAERASTLLTKRSAAVEEKVKEAVAVLKHKGVLIFACEAGDIYTVQSACIEGGLRPTAGFWEHAGLLNVKKDNRDHSWKQASYYLVVASKVTDLNDLPTPASTGSGGTMPFENQNSNQLSCINLKKPAAGTSNSTIIWHSTGVDVEKGTLNNLLEGSENSTTANNMFMLKGLKLFPLEWLEHVISRVGPTPKEDNNDNIAYDFTCNHWKLAPELVKKGYRVRAKLSTCKVLEDTATTTQRTSVVELQSLELYRQMKEYIDKSKELDLFASHGMGKQKTETILPKSVTLMYAQQFSRSLDGLPVGWGTDDLKFEAWHDENLVSEHLQLLSEKYGLKCAPSMLKDSGTGLIATKDFAKDDLICPYAGRLKCVFTEHTKGHVQHFKPTEAWNCSNRTLQLVLYRPLMFDHNLHPEKKQLEVYIIGSKACPASFANSARIGLGIDQTTRQFSVLDAEIKKELEEKFKDNDDEVVNLCPLLQNAGLVETPPEGIELQDISNNGFPTLEDWGAAIQDHPVWLKALSDIKKGEEIFLDYDGFIG